MCFFGGILLLTFTCSSGFLSKFDWSSFLNYLPESIPLIFLLFMVVVCPDCILIVEDFSLAKAPTSNGRKFYISSPRATTPATPSFPSTSFTGGDRSRDRLRRLMRDIIVGEAAPRPEEQIVTSLNECLQLSFHRCLRHIICLVYAREILLVDLRIQHTVTTQ